MITQNFPRKAFVLRGIFFTGITNISRNLLSFLWESCVINMLITRGKSKNKF